MQQVWKLIAKKITLLELAALRRSAVALFIYAVQLVLTFESVDELPLK